MVTFSSSEINVVLGLHFGIVQFSCKEPDWQASLMVKVCNQLSPLLSHMEQLDICKNMHGPAWLGNGIDLMQLLELFDPFPAEQYLQIYDG